MSEDTRTALELKELIYSYLQERREAKMSNLKKVSGNDEKSKLETQIKEIDDFRQTVERL